MNFNKLLTNANYYKLLIGVFAGTVLYNLRKYFKGPKALKKNMTGKTIIVTGSSDGIGKITALDLVRSGATVIFANRSEEKTKKVLAELENEDEKKRAIFYTLNLEDFSSVRSFVENVKSNYQNIDILVNNAGIWNYNFSLSKDNVEKTMQVNTLSPMILTEGLLPLINKQEGRIVNVSSRAYMNCKNFALDEKFFSSEYFETFETLKKLGTMGIYPLSKLGNVYFTQYLNKYLSEQNLKIKTVSLHPGVIPTNLFNEFNNIFVKSLLFLFYPIFWFCAKPLQYGAQTTLHACYVDFDKLESGKYYSDCAVQNLIAPANEDDTQCRKKHDLFIKYSKELINQYGKKACVSFSI